MKKKIVTENLGGGATLLTACSAGFGGAVWEKILRYYDTKALRSNCRVSKLPNTRQHTKYWWNLSCQPEALAEGSQKVNEKLKQVQHDKNFGTICKVQDAKYVNEAHRKHLFPYSPITLFTSKKAAFTLAEVLITLGIIGIVAAMTIPTLVANYKKKVVETRLVKVYSTFNQAIKMSEVENGPLTTWDVIEETQEFDDNNNLFISDSNIGDWYDKYLAPYVKTLKVEKNTGNKDAKINVYMPDGSLVMLSGNSWLIWPNANDYKPEEFGEDLGMTNRNTDDCGIKYFTFYFNPRPSAANAQKYHYGKGLEPYLAGWDGTKEMLLNHTRLGCNENPSNERAYCTQLIRMNNWKIPDDYPLKF